MLTHERGKLYERTHLQYYYNFTWENTHQPISFYVNSLIIMYLLSLIQAAASSFTLSSFFSAQFSLGESSTARAFSFQVHFKFHLPSLKWLPSPLAFHYYRRTNINYIVRVYVFVTTVVQEVSRPVVTQKHLFQEIV